MVKISNLFTQSLRNMKMDFYLDVYTILSRIKLIIWTVCAFRTLNPHQ